MHRLSAPFILVVCCLTACSGSNTTGETNANIDASNAQDVVVGMDAQGKTLDLRTGGRLVLRLPYAPGRAWVLLEGPDWGPPTRILGAASRDYVWKTTSNAGFAGRHDFHLERMIAEDTSSSSGNVGTSGSSGTTDLGTSSGGSSGESSSGASGTSSATKDFELSFTLVVRD
ncbi:MAG: hypothetical protein U0174_18930 [Polyangiaceae bacterium]